MKQQKMMVFNLSEYNSTLKLKYKNLEFKYKQIIFKVS